MDIDNLIIEVTRRCNMSCGHCLRGCQQNIDIEQRYITGVLENGVDQIGTVTFTGGEPSLNCRAIRHFINECQRLNISVSAFYIATNGKETTDEFMQTLLDLYLFCDEKDYCRVDISDDYYHDVEGQSDFAKESLMAFKFAGMKDRKEHDSMIFEGSFKDIANEDKHNKVSADNIYFEDGSIRGDFYLNAVGNIIHGCDWSYESQEKKENVFCRYDEVSEEAIQRCTEVFEE